MKARAERKMQVHREIVNRTSIGRTKRNRTVELHDDRRHFIQLRHVNHGQQSETAANHEGGGAQVPILVPK